MATAESPNESSRDWSARGALILGIVATFVLVGGFGAWSVTARIAGAIVASGTIEVEQNRQVVQHPDGGAVTDIFVREGDLVTAGQVLVRLDSDDLVSELTIIETHLIELRARRSRLEAERDGIENLVFPDDILEAIHRQPGLGDILTRNRELFDQRRETLRASIERLERRKRQIGNQIDGLAAQHSATKSQAALIAEEIETQQALVDRGLARVAPVLTLRREAARLEGMLGEIRAAIALNEERITEIDLESLTMKAQRREEAISLLSEQVVLALQVFGPGSVIRPAQPVLHIVPENPPLVIGARINPVHIGEVFVGQLASVRFSAFDTHRMPDLLGEVIAVSPDALTDERTGRDFYRVRIALRDGEALKLPPGAALLPGMPADAHLQTGSRSPLAYLTRPVTAYFRKALRES